MVPLRFLTCLLKCLPQWFRQPGLAAMHEKKRIMQWEEEANDLQLGFLRSQVGLVATEPRSAAQPSCIVS